MCVPIKCMLESLKNDKKRYREFENERWNRESIRMKKKKKEVMENEDEKGWF